MSRLAVGGGGVIAVALTALAFPLAERDARAGSPGCIYGEVVDGHTGKIRCLSPDEVTPPRSLPIDVPDAALSADAGDAGRAPARARDGGLSDSSAPVPLRLISVSIEALTFDNGDVPRAPVVLDRLKKEFARCAASEPQLSKGEGTIDVRFLVRAPGRAEGVDVAASRGVSSDTVRCVTSLLAGRPVGAPTSEPVGVSLTLRFKRD